MDISLRNFFAAHALQGLLANPNEDGSTPAAIAIEAFQLADLMLQETQEKMVERDAVDASARMAQVLRDGSRIHDQTFWEGRPKKVERQSP